MADLSVFELHGEALRLVAQHLGCHVQGLQQVARVARRFGRINGKLFRRLVVVDQECAVLWHITKTSCDAFMADPVAALSCAVAGTDSGGFCGTSPMEVVLAHDMPSEGFDVEVEPAVLAEGKLAAAEIVAVGAAVSARLASTEPST